MRVGNTENEMLGLPDIRLGPRLRQAIASPYEVDCARSRSANWFAGWGLGDRTCVGSGLKVKVPEPYWAPAPLAVVVAASPATSLAALSRPSQVPLSAPSPEMRKELPRWWSVRKT